MAEKKCPFSSLKEPDGPRGFPLLNSLPFLAWDSLGFFVSLRKKYGNIAKYKMFGTVSYLVSHPDDIAEVFKNESQDDVYEKIFFHEALYDYFGNGLLNSYGEDWRTQRDLLKPHFKKSENNKWFPIIVRESLINFQSIPKNNTTKININEVIKPTTQAIMCRILFGLKPENEKSKDLIAAIDLVSERLATHTLNAFILNGVLNKLPTPSNLKYKKAIRTIDKTIEDFGQNKAGKDGEGLLSLLLGSMPPKQVREQLFTLFFAGQDTSANAILWTLYHLAMYPESQNKARAEVTSLWSLLHNISIEDSANINDKTNELDYLNAVIDESMRLFPPVYATYRDVLKDTKLGLYKIKKKALVMLSMYVTHRNPGIWDKPDEFIPERFIGRSQKGFSFYPYGGGRRICLGMHLANVEMTTILALFIANFRFELEPGFKVKKETYAILRPKNGLPLIISPL